MTTLRTPRLADFSAEDRALLERTAKRMGRTAEALLEPSIMGVQTHWPAWLEANHLETNQSYRIQGKLPPIAKEAIHVAVSMTNHCSY